MLQYVPEPPVSDHTTKYLRSTTGSSVLHEEAKATAKGVSMHSDLVMSMVPIVFLRINQVFCFNEHLVLVHACDFTANHTIITNSLKLQFHQVFTSFTVSSNS